jgi:hypothetical protein
LQNKPGVIVNAHRLYTAIVHNRAGEAEKSDIKAKNLGKLKSESPTTNSWFDVAQVLAREGDHWKEFSSRSADAAGIPLNE